MRPCSLDLVQSLIRRELDDTLTVARSGPR